MTDSSPLEKVWLHDLTDEPKTQDELLLTRLARTKAPQMLRDAMESSRGAKCLSCGEVVRNLPSGVRRGIVILNMEITDDEGPKVFWGIVCCELCHERVSRTGECGL